MKPLYFMWLLSIKEDMVNHTLVARIALCCMLTLVGPLSDGDTLCSESSLRRQEEKKAVETPPSTEARPPKDKADLRFWMENMVWHHRYTTEEVASVLDMPVPKVEETLKSLHITPQNRPARRPNSPLKVLPYPGGRHPRIGFLEGAVNPQRETKISVFTPWEEDSYVVVDVPEAIWSNLGLTYLAHTHVPTVWTKQGIDLPKQEWQRRARGVLTMERTLPNGIAFGTKVMPEKEGVKMEMWLKNGTKEKLTDLRVQNCVMLKGATGFDAQTNDNKLFASPFVACHDAGGTRWVITVWEQCFHAWGNAPCPCLHSDPKFSDCLPGETVRLRGWLSFYEGTDIQAELNRLRQLGKIPVL